MRHRENTLEILIHTRDDEGLSWGSSCRNEDRQEEVFLRSVQEVTSAGVDR